MKKRGTKLAVLCAALVLCAGGYVLIQNLTPEPVEDIVEDTSTTIASLTSSDIQSMHWKYLDDELTLEKTSDGSWQYAADERFPLDQEVATAMLRAGSTVVSSQRIDAPEDLAEYGLEDPAMAIAMTDTEGAQTTYLLGDRNSLTGEYYMLLNEDSSTVWMAPESLFMAFAYRLYGMVQEEELPYIEEPRKATIEREGGTLAMEYIDDSEGLAYTDTYHWFLMGGDDPQPLDTVKVMELFDNVTQMTWGECIDYDATDEALETYGLAEPVSMVTLTYWAAETVDTGEVDEDGNAITEEKQVERTFGLELGAYSGSFCYARLPGSRMVYTVDAAILDAMLYADYTSLRPDDVCLIDWDTVTAFDVTLDGQTYTVAYDGLETIEDEEGNTSQKHVYTYDGRELDGTAVRNMLSQITRLSSTGSVDGAQGRGEAITFTFTRDTERDAEMTLTFHDYDSSSALVEFNGEKRLLVSKSSVDSIRSAVQALFAE